VTLNEIKRLGDTGISRYNNVDAFLVGAASNPAVQNQLKQIGIKYVDVTAGNIPELANKVDQLYGSIEEPDTGFRNMANGALDVMVGSMDGTDYQLPAPGHALGVPHGFGSPVGDEEQRPRSDGDGAEAAQRPGPHLLVQLQADTRSSSGRWRGLESTAALGLRTTGGPDAEPGAGGWRIGRETRTTDEMGRIELACTPSVPWVIYLTVPMAIARPFEPT
jgi:hypothetical protein